ncbi:MAG: hypothetical protein HZB19_12975 [Chloroflexi bacterium]|nr:hypothetical protein [Chloroflexota bacterium]
MTELIILAVVAALLLTLTLWKRKSPKQLRAIPAFTRLYSAMGLSVEDGTRLHISLGHGSLLTPRGGSALAALAMLRHLAERTSSSDRPPVASSGDPVLSLLTQDTLKEGYIAAGAEELFVPTTGRLTGMSPFGFAAGTMPVVRDENVSANIMVGSFGPESALIADAAERGNVITIGASDDLTAQSILFAAGQDALIGEELYASGAYLGAGAVHPASLTVQDILRWVIILVLFGGAFAKLAGVI